MALLNKAETLLEAFANRAKDEAEKEKLAQENVAPASNDKPGGHGDQLKLTSEIDNPGPITDVKLLNRQTILHKLQTRTTSPVIDELMDEAVAGRRLTQVPETSSQDEVLQNSRNKLLQAMSLKKGEVIDAPKPPVIGPLRQQSSSRSPRHRSNSPRIGPSSSSSGTCRSPPRYRSSQNHRSRPSKWDSNSPSRAEERSPRSSSCSRRSYGDSTRRETTITKTKNTEHVAKEASSVWRRLGCKTDSSDNGSQDNSDLTLVSRLEEAGDAELTELVLSNPSLFPNLSQLPPQQIKEKARVLLGLDKKADDNTSDVSELSDWSPQPVVTLLDSDLVDISDWEELEGNPSKGKSTVSRPSGNGKSPLMDLSDVDFDDLEDLMKVKAVPLDISKGETSGVSFDKKPEQMANRKLAPLGFEGESAKGKDQKPNLLLPEIIRNTDKSDGSDPSIGFGAFFKKLVVEVNTVVKKVADNSSFNKKAPELIDKKKNTPSVVGENERVMSHKNEEAGLSVKSELKSDHGDKQSTKINKQDTKPEELEKSCNVDVKISTAAKVKQIENKPQKTAVHKERTIKDVNTSKHDGTVTKKSTENPKDSRRNSTENSKDKRRNSTENSKGSRRNSVDPNKNQDRKSSRDCTNDKVTNNSSLSKSKDHSNESQSIDKKEKSGVSKEHSEIKKSSHKENKSEKDLKKDGGSKSSSHSSAEKKSSSNDKIIASSSSRYKATVVGSKVGESKSGKETKINDKHISKDKKPCSEEVKINDKHIPKDKKPCTEEVKKAFTPKFYTEVASQNSTSDGKHSKDKSVHKDVKKSESSAAPVISETKSIPSGNEKKHEAAKVSKVATRISFEDALSSVECRIKNLKKPINTKKKLENKDQHTVPLTGPPPTTKNIENTNKGSDDESFILDLIENRVEAPAKISVDDDDDNDDSFLEDDLLINEDPFTPVVKRKSLLDLPLPPTDPAFTDTTVRYSNKNASPQISSNKASITRCDPIELPKEDKSATCVVKSPIVILNQVHLPPRELLSPDPRARTHSSELPSLLSLNVSNPRLINHTTNPIEPLMSRSINVDKALYTRRPNTNDPIHSYNQTPAARYGTGYKPPPIAAPYQRYPRTYAEHKEFKRIEEENRRRHLEECEKRRREAEEAQRQEELTKAVEEARLRELTVSHADPRKRQRDEVTPDIVEKPFTSPLVSLYGTVSIPKSGKGYGNQPFRIPKKTSDLKLHLSHSGKQISETPVKVASDEEPVLVKDLSDAGTVQRKSKRCRRREQVTRLEAEKSSVPDVKEYVKNWRQKRLAHTENKNNNGDNDAINLNPEFEKEDASAETEPEVTAKIPIDTEKALSEVTQQKDIEADNKEQLIKGPESPSNTLLEIVEAATDPLTDNVALPPAAVAKKLFPQFLEFLKIQANYPEISALLENVTNMKKPTTISQDSKEINRIVSSVTQSPDSSTVLQSTKPSESEHPQNLDVVQVLLPEPEITLSDVSESQGEVSISQSEQVLIPLNEQKINQIEMQVPEKIEIPLSGPDETHIEVPQCQIVQSTLNEPETIQIKVPSQEKNEIPLAESETIENKEQTASEVKSQKVVLENVMSCSQKEIDVPIPDQVEKEVTEAPNVPLGKDTAEKEIEASIPESLTTSTKEPEEFNDDNDNKSLSDIPELVSEPLMDDVTTNETEMPVLVRDAEETGHTTQTIISSESENKPTLEPVDENTNDVVMPVLAEPELSMINSTLPLIESTRESTVDDEKEISPPAVVLESQSSKDTAAGSNNILKECEESIEAEPTKKPEREGTVIKPPVLDEKDSIQRFIEETLQTGVGREALKGLLMKNDILRQILNISDDSPCEPVKEPSFEDSTETMEAAYTEVKHDSETQSQEISSTIKPKAKKGKKVVEKRVSPRVKLIQCTTSESDSSDDELLVPRVTRQKAKMHVNPIPDSPKQNVSGKSSQKVVEVVTESKKAKVNVTPEPDTIKGRKKVACKQTKNATDFKKTKQNSKSKRKVGSERLAVIAEEAHSSQPGHGETAIETKKRRTELDWLHEELNSIPIFSDLMNTSAQRSCRAETEKRRETEKITENLDAVESEVFDDDKLQSSPSVCLSRLSANRINRIRGRNVARRGGRRGAFRRAASPAIPVGLLLLRNIRKATRNKSNTFGKKRRSLEEIIRNLKPVKVNAMTVTPTKNKLKNLRKKTLEHLVTLKNGRLIGMRELKSYVFPQGESVVSCLLCDDTGLKAAQVSKHYKDKHVDSEVLISRLSLSNAKNAKKDEMSNVMAEAPKRGQHWICRMCGASLPATDEEGLFLHISEHTGEFRWKCPAAGCEATALTRDSIRSHADFWHFQIRKKLLNSEIELFPVPSEFGHLFGYLCTRCNFVQTMRRNVEYHVSSFHSVEAESIDIVKIDMFSRGEEITKAVNYGKPSDIEEDVVNKRASLRARVVQTPPISPKKQTTKKVKSQGEDDEVNADVCTRAPVIEEVVPRPKRSVAKKGTGASAQKKLISRRRFLEDRLRKFHATQVRGKKPPVVQHTPLQLVLGPLQVQSLSNGTILFECMVKLCIFSASTMDLFERHVISSHSKARWDGWCHFCQLFVDSSPAEQGSLSTALSHIRDHVKDDLLTKTINTNPCAGSSQETQSADSAEVSTTLHSEPNSTKLLPRCPIVKTEEEAIVKCEPDCGESWDASSQHEKAAESSSSLNSGSSASVVRPAVARSPEGQQTPARPFLRVKTFEELSEIAMPSVTPLVTPSPIVKPHILPPISPSAPECVIADPLQITGMLTSEIESMELDHSASAPIIQISNVCTFRPTSPILPEKTTPTKFSLQQPHNAQQSLVSEPESDFFSISKESLANRPVMTSTIAGNVCDLWANSKSPSVYKEMLTESKLADLYKCMGHMCSFTGNVYYVFLRHCELHEKADKYRPSWKRCAYCRGTFGPSTLANHIQMEHGSSQFQCRYCFYRACRSPYVQHHQELLHPDKPFQMLTCSIPQGMSNAVMTIEKGAQAQFIKPYECTLCNVRYKKTKDFAAHLLEMHPTNLYHCHICQNRSVSVIDIITHYREHNINTFQCGYCLHGSVTQQDMMYHLCSYHFTRLPHMFLRDPPVLKSSTNSDPSKSDVTFRSNQEDGSTLAELLRVSDACSTVSLQSLLPNAQFSNTIEISSHGTGTPVPTPGKTLAVLEKKTPIRSKPGILKRAAPNKLMVPVAAQKLLTTPKLVAIESKTTEVSQITPPNDPPVSSKWALTPLTLEAERPRFNKRPVAKSQLEADRTYLDPESGELMVISGFGESAETSVYQPEPAAIRIADYNEEPINPPSDPRGLSLAPDVNEDVLSDADNDIEIIEPSSPPTNEIRDQMTNLRNQMQFETGSLLEDVNKTPERTDDDDSDVLLLSPIHAAVSSMTQQLAREVACKDGKNEVAETSVEDNPLNDVAEVNSARLLRSNAPLFTRRNLFKCGNASCTFSADTGVELKNHLVICNLDVQLSCSFCSFVTKSADGYVAHLQKHGASRYTCTMCGKRMQKGSMVKHVRQFHKTKCYRITPEDSTLTDPDHDLFTFTPFTAAESKKEHIKKKEEIKSKKSPKGKMKSSSVQSSGKSQPTREPNAYGPDDEALLPMSAIYSVQVKCTICPFYTKVRSNMVRHLRLHTEATRRGVVVPSSAPTNPVPCLDGSGKMFDKMTNLAASSVLDRIPVEGLTPADRAKLPPAVPDQQRYQCGDCRHITLDEKMLHHHITALHSELDVYRCPHCPTTLPEHLRVVSLDQIAHHLRHHDVKLYKCAHCDFFHFLRQGVERHLADTHPERRQFVHVVREPAVEPELIKVIKCSYCATTSDTAAEMLSHLRKKHEIKGKFKCHDCEFSSKTVGSFGPHFVKCHGGRKVKWEKSYTITETVASNIEVAQIEPVADTTPLWQRDTTGPRMIRGIPIDAEVEEEKKGKRKSVERQFRCLLCPMVTAGELEFRQHLYNELDYVQFSCKLCSCKFFTDIDAAKHGNAVHPGVDAIVPSEPKVEIDSWIEACVLKQKANMRDSGDGQSISKKSKKLETSPEGTKKAAKKEQIALSSKRKKIDMVVSIPEDYVEICSGGGLGTQELNLKCPHCSMIQRSAPALKIHITCEHLRMGRFECLECPRTFLTESLAKRHSCTGGGISMVTILNPRCNWYQLTDQFWEIEYNLTDSQHTVCRLANHEAKSVNCPQCPWRGSREGRDAHVAAKHRRRGNRWWCEVLGCSFSAMSQNELNRHDSIHYWKLSMQGTIIYDVNFTCEICPSIFKAESKLLQHAKDEHDYYGDAMWESCERYFICGYCHMVIQGREHAHDHWCVTHAKDGLEFVVYFSATIQHHVALYGCPYCTYRETSLELCESHIKTHAERFVCVTCNNVFDTEELAQNHLKTLQHAGPISTTLNMPWDRLKNLILVEMGGKLVSLAVARALANSGAANSKRTVIAAGSPEKSSPGPSGSGARKRKQILPSVSEDVASEMTFGAGSMSDG